MYQIIKSVIESGRYELADMLGKIDRTWLQGSITEEEMTELVTLAREKATPENSYASLRDQVNKLFGIVAEQAKAIKANADAITMLQGGTVTPPVQEEYPEYVQPSGAHDAYNTGDKMTYTDGKRYIGQMDGCVWNPDTYPQAWKEVTE